MLPLLLLSLPLLAPAAARADAAGQRVEIDVPAAATAPDAKAVLDVLTAGQKPALVRVQVVRDGGGTTILRFDLAGVTLPADVAGTLRAAFPALQGAQIAVTALDAASMPPPPDTTDPWVLKKQLEDKLAAEGKTGTVDVQVQQTPDGQKKVEVKVQAVQEE
jgi:hypothetical protein